MAAALIPLIAGLAPAVINLIVGLVHHKAPVAEQNGGPLTGPSKFADVFVGTMADLVKAHAAGQIDVLPDEPTVKVILQAVVTSMQLSGYLGGAITGPVPATQSPVAGPNCADVVLNAGHSLLVTA
jgi:hypothetical protein